MREIKFRNWYKPKEGRLYSDITPPKMIYLSFCQTIDSGRTLVFTDEERTYIDESDFEEPILMQYTGLKDKNGKEIFEGDIVSVKLPDTPHYVGGTILGKIEYDEVGCRFNINQYFENEFCYDYYDIHEDLSIEIKGNIYQNPELL